MVRDMHSISYVGSWEFIWFERLVFYPSFVFMPCEVCRHKSSTSTSWSSCDDRPHERQLNRHVLIESHGW